MTLAALDQDGAGPADLLVDLLQLAGAQDHLAYAELCRLCRPRLAKYAARFGVCRSTVDDILQDTLIAVWLSAAHYSRSGATPITWMIAILRNKAIDHLRADVQSRRWQREFTAGTLDWHSAVEPPEMAVERLQSAQQLGRGMAALKAPQRTAIELAFFQDMSCSDVAARMSIPIGTAKTLIRRGQIKLHAHLRRCGVCHQKRQFTTPPGEMHV